MKHLRSFAAAMTSIALASCASQSADTYDTGDPYGYPDAGTAQAPLPEYDNPVYDTPAAYEDSSAAPAASAATPAPATQSATIHTVVKGDTLSGLSAKYKVPMESIKRANRMTNDTVILGRKMVIPPQ